MMASTITTIPTKTLVERKPRGGYRFTVEMEKMNAWFFDLTDGEFEELFDQMMRACNTIPTKFLAVSQTASAPQSQSSPQPPPTGNGQVVLWQAIAKAIEAMDLAEADWLCELLHERAIEGKKEYKTWLRANNGRDAAKDYLQEEADAFMYATQEWLETSSDNARAKQEAALAAILLCYEDARKKVGGEFDGFGK